MSVGGISRGSQGSPFEPADSAEIASEAELQVVAESGSSSALVNLDAPAGHRLPPAEQKKLKGSDEPLKVETSVRTKLAPLCRSTTGLNVPITRWPHCADHQLAQMCRSVTQGGRFSGRRAGVRRDRARCPTVRRAGGRCDLGCDGLAPLQCRRMASPGQADRRVAGRPGRVP